MYKFSRDVLTITILNLVHNMSYYIGTLYHRMHVYNTYHSSLANMQSLWCNGSAYWTSNSKVVGSSLTRDELCVLYNMYHQPN